MNRLVNLLVAMSLVSAVRAEPLLRWQSGTPARPGLKLGATVDRTFVLDWRYTPPDWQTSICLIDDGLKTLVGKDGAMLYDYGGSGSAAGFATRVTLHLDDGEDRWVGQRIEDPRVPIVITEMLRNGIELRIQAFAVPDTAVWPSPPTREFVRRAGIPASQAVRMGPPRADLVLATLTNQGPSTVEVRPQVRVHSTKAIRFDKAAQIVWVGDRPMIGMLPGATVASRSERECVVVLPAMSLPPGESRQLVVPFHHSVDAITWSIEAATRALDAARAYWRKADLPYGRISVPDANVRAMIDSSIRNIYQAREIKDGLPAFQVGPTCYRGLWIVDGAFLLEAVTMLNRSAETRAGVQYMLNHQNADGSFELLTQYWKETGIVLWVIDRHEQLTGDTAWLRETWPRVERAVQSIQSLRRKASQDPAAPYAGLVPPGFPDGGLGGPIAEYTNVYWLLVGLESAVAIAARTGHTDQAAAWQREYDDMWRAFRKAAERDLAADAFGNKMLPVPMQRPLDRAPHKALWAFCHAIHPGELFAPDDPIMLGTLASLTDNECEGLVKGTGWLDTGIWNYFGGFYGHAFAWLGQGDKAAQVLYAFGNHASPLLAWREEQSPVGQGGEICGDMPHNWASAEFIRLSLHLLVFERGDELHLLEGLPPTWLTPGAKTTVEDVLTRFGPFSMMLRVSDDGQTADLEIRPPARRPPARLVLHTRDWAEAVMLDGRALVDGRDLSPTQRSTIRITIRLPGHQSP
ncbi:MAG: hypothetical protein HY718_16920 [Planctomycetes bacterium]|nr:hypothetical protein [Planctomycetota bacterium]